MYLRTDEEAEAANAMEMVARFTEGVEDDPRLWRWIIIALHNAVQGDNPHARRQINDGALTRSKLPR